MYICIYTYNNHNENNCIYIYIMSLYLYIDPLWFPVSLLRPFGFLPSFHPVETAHCAVCRKQKWCWKLLTQRKQMYQFMKCRSRRQQCGNVFKDLNLRMSQGGESLYIAWYKLSMPFKWFWSYHVTLICSGNITFFFFKWRSLDFWPLFFWPITFEGTKMRTTQRYCLLHL